MRRFSTAILYGFVTTTALAAGQTSRGVGSGLAFAPPSYSTVVNPAAVVAAPSAALAASYRTENKNPFASFAGSTGGVGIAAAYRQEGASKTEGKNSQRKDVVEAAAGARLLFLTLGATARKVKDKNADFDGALMLDLGPLRLGTVMRDMDQGPDRIDGFVGVKLGSFHLEFDAKKARPYVRNEWLIDAAFALVTPDFSASIGYDATYDENKMSHGEVHGGLSIRIFEALFVEGMYRPFAQEWSSSDWLAGARLVF